MDLQKARQQVKDVLGPALGRQEPKPQKNTCITAPPSPAQQLTHQALLQCEKVLKRPFNCYIMELTGRKNAMVYIFKRFSFFFPSITTNGRK